MKKYYNNFHKNSKENLYNNDVCKDNKDVYVGRDEASAETNTYSYYSKVLKKPFDSLEELRKAEDEHQAALTAKETKAAQKKLDAKKVEDAFKALNSARKVYKESLKKVTDEYRESLETLKKSFDAARTDVKNDLAKAEKAYSTALKEFTEKYSEGFHLTLKDGDVETVITSTTSDTTAKPAKTYDLFNVFDWIDYLF